MFGDEIAQFLRHRGAAEHVDDRAAAAALEQRLEQPHEIFGFFLHFDVAVADDAEQAGADDGITGKQPVQEQPDDVLQ